MSLTVVLVHGAYAESASWNGVISRLHAAGHKVIAFANPLRSLSGDAAALSDLLSSIDGPVVLVGHSYGGAVASNAALGHENVKALVFVASLAPEAGENVPDLTGKFPGATLGEHVHGVLQADGSLDFYVDQDAYHEHFAADLTPEQAALDVVAQRPVNAKALEEPSGPPAWKSIPSWFIYAELDRAIPTEASRHMAERAGARAVVEVPGASHALPASRAGGRRGHHPAGRRRGLLSTRGRAWRDGDWESARHTRPDRTGPADPSTFPTRATSGHVDAPPGRPDRPARGFSRG